MSDQSATQTRELAPARSAWHVALVRPETMTFLLLIFGLIGASYLSPFFLDINYILRSFTLTAEMSIVAPRTKPRIIAIAKNITTGKGIPAIITVLIPIKLSGTRIDLSPAITCASPRKKISVPIVTMIEGSCIRIDKKAFSAPIIKPANKATNTAR